MAIKITIDAQSRKAIASLGFISKRAKEGIRAAFYDIGRDLRKDIRNDILFAPKSGRTYLVRLKGRIKRHKSSAPGETAANLTGKYFNSIDYNVKGSNQLEFGSRVIHGKFLEEGTRRMKPRPGLGNSIRKKESEIEQYLAAAIKRNLRK